MAKVVLITGISSGFGKAIAEILAAEGFQVYGISRSLPDNLSKSIKVLQADVTDRASVQRAVSIVLKNEGQIDVLINNAGMGFSCSVEDSSPENIDLLMNKTNRSNYRPIARDL